jgi:hypothetical protein
MPSSSLAFDFGAWRARLVEALQENSEPTRDRLLRRIGVQHPKLLAHAPWNDAPHFRFLGVFKVHVGATVLPFHSHGARTASMKSDQVSDATPPICRGCMRIAATQQLMARTSEVARTKVHISISVCHMIMRYRIE